MSLFSTTVAGAATTTAWPPRDHDADRCDDRRVPRGCQSTASRRPAAEGHGRGLPLRLRRPSTRPKTLNRPDRPASRMSSSDGGGTTSSRCVERDHERAPDQSCENAREERRFAHSVDELRQLPQPPPLGWRRSSAGPAAASTPAMSARARLLTVPRGRGF